MAGICTALLHLKAFDFESAVVVSCDTPHLPLELVKTLNSKSHSDSLVAVAHDGNRKQNLHCRIKRAAWDALISSYQSGERAMHRWYKEIKTDEINFSTQAESFLNINSAELIDK